jgi:hypothetical protein
MNNAHLMFSSKGLPMNIKTIISALAVSLSLASLMTITGCAADTDPNEPEPTETAEEVGQSEDHLSGYFACINICNKYVGKGWSSCAKQCGASPAVIAKGKQPK